MLQKDYLLRLVEEFAQALILLRNQKDRNKKMEEMRRHGSKQPCSIHYRRSRVRMIHIHSIGLQTSTHPTASDTCSSSGMVSSIALAAVPTAGKTVSNM